MSQMKNFLTWGVDGNGLRHYLCRFCGERFGSGIMFEDEVDHVCKEKENGKMASEIKLTKAQQKILDGGDHSTFHYSKLSGGSKRRFSSCVPLHRNHRSAYKLEELGFGKVHCIAPFDGSFFLRFNNGVTE